MVITRCPTGCFKNTKTNKRHSVTRRNSTSRYFSLRPSTKKWLGVIIGVVTVMASVGSSEAASLSSASVALTDPRPAQVAGYNFSTSGVTLSTIKCIKAVFSDSTAGTVVPTGMVTTAASFDTVGSNYMPTPSSWSLNKTTNGTLTLIDAAGETPASINARKVNFTGITNGTTADTRYFLKFTTYNNVDCVTTPIDSTVVDYIFTNGSTLSLTVDPTLSFSVNAVASGQSCDGTVSTATSTATTIPFGSVTPAANSVVCQDLTAATNASNGFTIYARYTSRPTNSLGQTIADTAATNTAPAAFPAPGNEAYGYSTSDATLGTGTPGRFSPGNWAAMSNTNAELAYEPSGVNATTYRVGHQVGVGLTTRPGTYVTTIIYTCTPIY
jgi:hypothetical protein